MKLEELKELLEQAGLSDSVVFENPDYADAVIGYDQDSGRVIYSYSKIVEYLMEQDGLTQKEAVDFLDYNYPRALPYDGKLGPIIMQDLK